MPHLRELIKKPAASDRILTAVIFAVVASIAGSVLVHTKGCTNMRTGTRRRMDADDAAKKEQTTVTVRPDPYKRITLGPREWSQWMKPPVGASKSWYYEAQPPQAKTVYEVEFSGGEVREFYGNRSTGKKLSEMRRARYRNLSDSTVTLLFFCDCADQEIAREVEAERDQKTQREAMRSEAGTTPGNDRGEVRRVASLETTDKIERVQTPKTEEKNPCSMGLLGVGPMAQHRRCVEWKKKQAEQAKKGEWTITLAVGEELGWERRGRNGEVEWSADGTVQVTAQSKTSEGRHGMVAPGTQGITFVNVDVVPVTVTLRTAPAE
jgi:hypothetical protein